MVFDFTILRPRLDGMGVYSLNMYLRFGAKMKKGALILNRGFANGRPLEGVSRRLKLVPSALIHRFSPGLLRSLFSRELYYSPTQHGPAFYRHKVITVHDLNPLLIPTKSLKQHIYARLYLPISIRRSIFVITDADLTKTLITRLFGIPPDRIKVVRAGTDVEQVVPRAVEGVRSRGYFLMVGVNSEYKNHKRVIEAFVQLDRKDFDLVVTSNNPEIAAFCSSHARVTVKRYLGLDELVYLYRNAAALVYPSLMEGFGLPALEAARLGTPIITSKGSTMEEFLGPDNVLYVDPNSTPAILAAMATVANGGYPVEMVERVREATAGLIWDNTAAEVLGILEEAERKIRMPA